MILLGSQSEEAAIKDAKAYLRSFAEEQFGRTLPCRWAAVVAESSSQGIVGFAEREQVDTIALYVRDRAGLAKLMKGNTSRAVLRKAKRPVRLFGPHDFDGVTSEPVALLVAAAAAAAVFAMRYTSTLTHLGVAAERELRGSVNATSD